MLHWDLQSAECPLTVCDDFQRNVAASALRNEKRHRSAYLAPIETLSPACTLRFAALSVVTYGGAGQSFARWLNRLFDVSPLACVKWGYTDSARLAQSFPTERGDQR